MSSDTIVSDPQSTANQSERLKSSINGYSSIAFKEYSGATTGIPGSATHDAATSSFHGTLQNWKVLVYSDANAIRDTGLAFSETDTGIANKLLGIGS